MNGRAMVLLQRGPQWRGRSRHDVPLLRRASRTQRIPNVAGCLDAAGRRPRRIAMPARRQARTTVETAKNASAPQGLIVAILHGHANRETNIMMNGGA